MAGKYLTLKDRRRLIARLYGEEARVLDIANKIATRDYLRGATAWGHWVAGCPPAPGV